MSEKGVVCRHICYQPDLFIVFHRNPLSSPLSLRKGVKGVSPIF